MKHPALILTLSALLCICAVTSAVHTHEGEAGAVAIVPEPEPETTEEASAANAAPVKYDRAEVKVRDDIHSKLLINEQTLLTHQLQLHRLANPVG